MYKQLSVSSLEYFGENFFPVQKNALVSLLSIITMCDRSQCLFFRVLYRYLRKRSDEDISLESYVYHLLYYVPLPPPSRSVKLPYFGESITCPRPKSSELPLFDYFMSDLFRLLDLDSFLQLFTCVLLENQVLLYSKGKWSNHNFPFYHFQQIILFRVYIK